LNLYKKSEPSKAWHGLWETVQFRKGASTFNPTADANPLSPVYCARRPTNSILDTPGDLSVSDSKTMAPVHKPELDRYLDRHLRVPTQVVSNEEFIPLPQTARRPAVENAWFEMGSRISKELGVDRRQFFPVTCGMAGFAAMNSVFGHFFKLDPALELHAEAQSVSARI
jgi:hypothetical protein